MNDLKRNLVSNMIKEDYVSFEVAKLLKEKGFDEECNMAYFNGTLVDYTMFGFCLGGDLLYCPTIQMAMKWLREVHNINPVPYATSIGWYFEVFDLTQRDITGCALLYDIGIPSKEYTFDTYEEVCDAAIKYCLENFIKNEDKEEESEIPVPKTVDEAVKTLAKILSDEDREYLLENGAISMHNSLGRWIRNEWGLWAGSELKDELMNMNKGLNHPDDMSNYIIVEFFNYWNNKL